MIKKCANCKKATLLCIKCKEAGAFDKGGENKEVHKGDCVYETCRYCEDQHEKRGQVKRTTITPEEVTKQQERDGFQPICCYGSIAPEENEIGGIFKGVRNIRVENGLFVSDAECVERIFLAHRVG